MKLPGPDHPIAVTPNPKRVIVTFNGAIIADSRNALELKEASYPPVQYIPRADVAMARLTPTENSTYCPYKGDASYFSIEVDGKVSQNAVWSYETPYPAMAQIAGHVAFYPNRVDRIEIG